MKIQRTEQIQVDFDVEIESVDIHCYGDGKGITLVVNFEDAAEEAPEILIPWDKFLKGFKDSTWAWNEGDGRKICGHLRKVADELEAWCKGGEG